MNKRVLPITLAACLFSGFAFATPGNGKITYETDPATGVKYHFFKHDKKGGKPVMGDVAHVLLTIKTDRDSVFFSSKQNGDSLGAIWIPLNKTFNGCLEQGVIMMAAGDSACFSSSADSVFTKTFRTHIPPYIKGGSSLTFNVRLLNFKTQQQFLEEKQKAMEKQQEQSKAAEAGTIQNYLKSKNLNVAADSNGLYILSYDKTSGIVAKEGDSVEVKYKGTFLDGKVFDASANHGGKGTFSFVYSKNAPLIQGWIRIVGFLREGEKITVLIPSNLAYGPRGGGPIPPNTPLIFEMEMVKVTSHQPR